MQLEDSPGIVATLSGHDTSEHQLGEFRRMREKGEKLDLVGKTASLPQQVKMHSRQDAASTVYRLTGCMIGLKKDHKVKINQY